MNQQIVELKEQRMPEKASILVLRKKVRRSPCAESRNIWMVGSYSTYRKWYVVRWIEEYECFQYACEAYKYSSNNMCLHIAAAATYERTSSD